MWIVKGVNGEVLEDVLKGVEPGGLEGEGVEPEGRGPEEDVPWRVEPEGDKPEGDEPEGDEPWRARGKPREDEDVNDDGGGGRVEGNRLPSKTEAR